MYKEINQEIYSLKEKIRAKEKLENLRELAIEEYNKNLKLMEELKDKLNKEKQDVTKLEGTSLSSFFFSIIGKKEEKLDKERREYLAVKIQYDEHILAMKELDDLIKKYDEELIKYRGVEETYKNLIAEKQRLLIREDTPKGRNLRNLLEKLNELKLDIKEVNEAIFAGENAYNALVEMKEPLESAKGWGTWDLLGGGFFSDIMKHSHLDDANRLSYNVQHHLKVFQKELADVNEFTEIKVNISSFAKFADFFFDGLFADWFVQSRINESLSNVESAIRRVKNILDDLRRSLRDLEVEKAQTESEINLILEV